MPVYPKQSREKGRTGVAVVEISLDENHRVVASRILEAPSQPMGQAVKDAVAKWKFPGPSNQDDLICFKGKLTFYFLINNGIPYVKNPRRYERR